MHIIEEKWNEILEHLKTEYGLTDVSVKTWIEPLSIYQVKDDTVTILVPSGQLGLDYVSRKYTLPLKASIGEITGQYCDIRFILPEEIKKASLEKEIETLSRTAGLDPKYTFDTFVVGSNNSFAHAASLAVAESPGKIYNPLFIHGGVGLGKTHLMNSIAHFILQNNPDTKILYITSEAFTNEVINAIRTGLTAIEKLREKYRTIDVLLIDDIQFIIGKESTQEEFFHTFNTLHAAGKQIVISSDRPPKDMDVLEERIRSRFEWGLMADIQSPGYETRMAILRKKQELDGFNVSEDVLQYIAENVKSNIRELEGSLNIVRAKARLENEEITVDLAKKALADIINPDEKRTVTADYIVSIVADYFNISVSDIRSSVKSRKIAYPRQVAMYLIRLCLPIGYQDIAAAVGVQNHTTIMHGCKKIENDYNSSEEVREMIDLLKKKISPQG